MPTTNQLLVSVILYGLLPLWGITGFIDWCCHRATRIESTSGLRESLVHSLMGVQLGIPIVLCLVFKVNGLILLLCFAAFLAHEFAAHYDVHYANSRREISIWEMHVHNYMATIPLYLMMLIVVLNWPLVVRLAGGDWSGQWRLVRLERPFGAPGFLTAYLAFMTMLCVVPYVEENLRCLRHWRARRLPAA